MAKLRHIAVTVPDMEEAATFYEKTFGMERVFESGIVIMLSDGTISLAILKFKTDEQARFALCKLASALARPTPRCSIVHAGFCSIRA